MQLFSRDHTNAQRPKVMSQIKRKKTSNCDNFYFTKNPYCIIFRFSQWCHRYSTICKRKNETRFWRKKYCFFLSRPTCTSGKWNLPKKYLTENLLVVKAINDKKQNVINMTTAWWWHLTTMKRILFVRKCQTQSWALDPCSGLSTV